ncbi:MAG TPA: hypothetical protein VJ785_13420 [Anaerolineales bacterium]|nr:hypothetical protein [Anaerolineales bacterium]
MNTFRRILAWTVVVLSIIGILICSLGVMGAWLINAPLTDGLLKLVSAAQAPLSSVEEVLSRSSTKIEGASASVDSVSKSASQLGDNFENNSPILDRMTQKLREELSPIVEEIREALLPIQELLTSVNNTLEALNTLPGVELPTLTPKAEALNERAGTVRDSVQELETNISDIKSGVVENRLVPFIDRIDRLAGLLAALEEEVNTDLEQLRDLQAALANVQAKIPSVIDGISIAFSILFLWLVLAQVSLVFVARLYLRTGQRVWEIIPPEKSSESAPLAPSS